MDIFAAFNDPEFDGEMKTLALLKIFYPEWQKIPPEDIREAIEKACEFIDCGHKRDNKHLPKTIDWEQDAALIIPAVNQIAKMEVRSNPNIHWWTFFGWFMSSEDNLLSTVLNIRKKKATGKKLEKWEQEFYRDNQKLIDIHRKHTPEELSEIEAMKKWL